jgi:cobalt-zinc-cadmium efflux system outer membrane protein
MVRLAFFILCIHGFVLTASAQAGTSKTGTDTLSITLKDAEALMIAQNLQLLARKYDIEAAKAQIIQARLWDNPILYAETNPWNGQTGKFLKYYPSGVTDAKGNIAGSEAIGYINQLIKTAGKRSNLVNLNKINAQISEYVFYDLLRSLKYTLRDDYSLLIQFQQSIQLLDEEIVSIERLVRITQEQLAKGNFAEKDLIRLQALEFALQMLKRDYKMQSSQTQAEIKTLLGLKPTVVVQALRDSSIFSRKMMLPPDSLIEMANKNRADLKVMEGQWQSALMNVKLQKSNAVPDFSVTVNTTKYSNYVVDYIGLGITTNLPLLNRNQGNIKTAKFNSLSAEGDFNNYTKKVSNDVVASYSNLLVSRDAYEGFDKPFVGRFDIYFQKLLINFQRRVIGLIEFIDFFETYRDTKLASFNLEQDYFESREQLNFNVGTDVIKNY